MLKNKSLGSAKIGLIIGIIAVIAIVFVIFNQTATNDAATSQSNDRVAAEGVDTSSVEELNGNGEEEAAVELSKEAMDKAPDTMEKDDMMTDDHSAETMTKAGTYADYDEAMLAKANGGKVVLFFHASWCPSCRSLEKNVESNLSNIPDDVTILVVNYDKETDLKKKYGVTRQHTLVQVDANGDKIQTLNGLTNTLDQVVAQL